MIMADDRVSIFKNLDLEYARENPRIFFKALKSALIFLAKEKIAGPFIIIKDAKVKDISKVVVPPELKAEFSDVEINDLIDKKLRETIESFLEVVMEKIPKENLINLYNNINKIIEGKGNDNTQDYNKTSLFDVVIRAQSVKENPGASGIYSPLGNIISVEDSSNTHTIYHELFHLSSSIRAGKEDNTYFSGFAQTYYSYKEGLVKIGDGLNEGYTELLTKRYFPSENRVTSCYEIALYFASKVEELIGKDKMQSFYLNANLKGLIDSLKEYAGEKDIMEFITNTDFLLKHFDDSKNKKFVSRFIDAAIENSVDFLFNCELKKIAKESKEGKYENVQEVFGEIVKFCSMFNGFDFSKAIQKFAELKPQYGKLIDSMTINKDGYAVNYVVLEKMNNKITSNEIKELLQNTSEQLNKTIALAEEPGISK